MTYNAITGSMFSAAPRCRSPFRRMSLAVGSEIHGSNSIEPFPCTALATAPPSGSVVTATPSPNNSQQRPTASRTIGAVPQRAAAEGQE